MGLIGFNVITVCCLFQLHENTQKNQSLGWDNYRSINEIKECLHEHEMYSKEEIKSYAELFGIDEQTTLNTLKMIK